MFTFFFLNNQFFIFQILFIIFILFTVIYILTNNNNNNNNTITAVLIHNHKISDQINAAIITSRFFIFVIHKKINSLNHAAHTKPL